MKVIGWMRPVLVATLALPYVGGLAQDVTLPDLVNGEKLAHTIKASELPAEYKAVKLKVAGESGLMDMFSGPYGMLIAMSGGMHSSGNEGGQMELASMMELSWTKGETVHLISAASAAAKAAGTVQPAFDDEYLVTYKAELGFAQLMALSSNKGALSTDLKLSLVKLSSISSITPAPDVTKDRLVKALESAGSWANADSTTGPVAEKATAPGASPGSRDQTAAQSNAKQLALGMIMYCSDNDDVMPYAQTISTVKEVIAPYLRNNDLWQTKNPASQWRLNMAISGVSMSSIPEPASTPMFYESAPWPDGRRVVAFCDGHTQLVDKAKWDAMAKYLKLKLKRTAKKPLPVHQPGMDIIKEGSPALGGI